MKRLFFAPPLFLFMLPALGGLLSPTPSPDEPLVVAIGRLDDLSKPDKVGKDGKGVPKGSSGDAAGTVAPPAKKKDDGKVTAKGSTPENTKDAKKPAGKETKDAPK